MRLHPGFGADYPATVTLFANGSIGVTSDPVVTMTLYKLVGADYRSVGCRIVRRGARSCAVADRANLTFSLPSRGNTVDRGR